MNKQGNIPTIVVLAYNRPEPLSRLLGSLLCAEYGAAQVPLIISLDHDPHPEVLRLAQSFDWPYGNKQINVSDKPLGTRAHVLQCGDLTDQYESVIILEDDLMVSPYFYTYSKEALHFCQSDASVAGISLYSYDVREFKHLRFMTMQDGFDNYYLQLPSSWGQLWTKEWWREFRGWLDQGEVVSPDIHPAILDWPEHSWKKTFISYLVDQDKYFFYPRVSHTTNFGDLGQNHKGEFARYQVPIEMGQRAHRFGKLEESKAVYDAFFEPVVTKVNRSVWMDQFPNLEFDLFGDKHRFRDETQYVLTTRRVRNVIRTFAATMLPLEMNVYMEVEGEGINLAKKADVDLSKRPMNPRIHERITGRFSKQRYGIQYLYQLMKQNRK